MNILGIIPARFASSRFPGKPLVMIGDKSMIQRVYEQSSIALKNVVVATDDLRIYNHVSDFGGKVVMTSENHNTGTDRCAEAAKKFIEKYPEHKINVVINIQGDEPFIEPKQIVDLANCFNQSNTQIATIIRKEEKIENLKNANIVKVIIDNNNNAIYFSRTIIPFIRDCDPDKWTSKHDFFVHVGIYGYRLGVLNSITKLSTGLLEKAESLEQNRWIENGYIIKTSRTTFENRGIDTPEDLKEILNSKKNKIL
jgi:3-deoxy-manno-octulosonate cytidylyltransferase (CMP-KDO synthetase)